MLNRAALEVLRRRDAGERVIGALPQPHDAQQSVLEDEARFRVVVCGRRFGKTELGKRELVKRVLRGERIWWLAPTYAIGSIAWRAVYPLFRGYPDAYINRSDRRVALPNGGWFEVRSTHNPDNLRGEGLDFAVMDEAAFVEDGVWAQVVRPMLATDNGGALFLSSPYGRNWLWKLYNLGLDPLEHKWSSHHYTSADGGLITTDELADIRRNTPERVFREEYLAEFLEDSGSVFRGVDAAATAPDNAQRTQGHRYVMGIDWARDNDYTVAVVIDATDNRMVAIDRFNTIGWHVQRGRVLSLYEQWQPSSVWAEANSIGSVNIEELQREGLPIQPFMTTARSKGPLIEGLALAIERSDVAIMPDDVLLNELKAYELKRSTSGHYQYSAPSGAHDDTVIALALAWHGVTNYTHNRGVRFGAYTDGVKQG